MGVAEGKATDVPVHVRGNHLTPGEVVAAAVPGRPGRRDAAGVRRRAERPAASWRRWLDRPGPPADRPRDGQPHLALALRPGARAARRTTSAGSARRPTHPELLDWLARRFVEDGWSIKAMHRLIMLSSDLPDEQRRTTRRPRRSTRRTGCCWRIERPPAGGRGDPRRAAGRRRRARPDDGRARCCTSRTASYVFDHTSKDETTYDSRRRSVYLPVDPQQPVRRLPAVRLPRRRPCRTATGPRRRSPRRRCS